MKQDFAQESHLGGAIIYIPDIAIVPEQVTAKVTETLADLGEVIGWLEHIDVCKMISVVYGYLVKKINQEVHDYAGTMERTDYTVAEND